MGGGANGQFGSVWFGDNTRARRYNKLQVVPLRPPSHAAAAAASCRSVKSEQIYQKPSRRVKPPLITYCPRGLATRARKPRVAPVRLGFRQKHATPGHLRFDRYAHHYYNTRARL